MPADHWTRWWYANRLFILDMHGRIRDRQATTPSSADATKTNSELWRAQAQEALTLALSDADEDIASGAAVALGKAGDPEDAASLVAVLANPQRRQSVREAAALGLGLLPPRTDGVNVRSALELVAADERAPDRLRGFALYALGMRGETAAVPFLLDAANVPTATSWDVPTAASSALGLSRCGLTKDDLVRILAATGKDRSKETMRRVYAAHGLARLGDPTAAPALREAGVDDDADVRRASILSLSAVARADDVQTTDFLIHVLHSDRDRACRNMAAVALARIGADRASRELRWAYLNGDALEKPFAALGLGLIARRGRDPEIAKSLRHDLEQRGSSELRGALCIAVGLAGDLDAAQALRKIAAEQGDADVRAQAAMGLGLLGDRDGAPPVLRALLTDAPSPAVQREAAFALGMLGDRDAEKILLDLVVNGSGVYVQGSAAVALGRIGGRECSAALVAMLKNKDKPGISRGMAAVSLGLLLDRTDGRALASVGADLDWYQLTPTAREILDIL
jgi:HEAT repeat protein